MKYLYIYEKHTITINTYFVSFVLAESNLAVKNLTKK